MQVVLIGVRTELIGAAVQMVRTRCLRLYLVLDEVFGQGSSSSGLDGGLVTRSRPRGRRMPRRRSAPSSGSPLLGPKNGFLPSTIQSASFLPRILILAGSLGSRRAASSRQADWCACW